MIYVEMTADGGAMNRIIEEDIDNILKTPYLNFERFRDKTVLISGAYGMLASYLIWPLVMKNQRDADFHCTILAVGRSAKKMGTRFGAAVHEPFFRAVYGDISDLPAMEKKPDFIIHAASPTDPRSYLTDPDAVWTANVSATKNLLELADKSKSESFLFISSGEVYGTVEKASVDESDLGVLDPDNPRNVYALAKREGERLCSEYAGKLSVPVKIARPSHTYGPAMNLAADGRAFAEFVSDAVHGRDIHVKSNGSAQRAFIYLTDAAAGYYKILLDGMNGEAYNVSNVRGVRSIGKLAEYIAGCTPNADCHVVYEKPDSGYQENPNRIPCIRSTDKLESLGWKAEVTPEEGFARTVRSFLSGT